MSGALTLMAKVRSGVPLVQQVLFYPVTGEADVLRDEGEACANKLHEAGVPVTSVRYQGIIHDFVMLNALRGTHAAEAAINQAIGTLSSPVVGQAYDVLEVRKGIP